MRPVDEKIVKLTMDSDDFSKKASNSESLLSKLRSAFDKLKQTDVTKPSSDIAKLKESVNGVKMDSLRGALDTITQRFTTLGIVGTTALINITNRAIDATMNIGRMIAIEPITTGFAEYEQKLKSIQVIKSNTQGKNSMEEITNALEDLNIYADKTIYNFQEMTRNIGTFTAAGIELNTAKESIKGIANLAAASGSTSQQASVAMYQLSQALAAGTVKLMDWNSVVNAGMGGKLFQDALKTTAKEMGVVVDESKSFRESLQDGWITSEVLVKTLEKFAKDESMLEAATKVRTFTQFVETLKESLQSGWAQTWEKLLGGFEESGRIWTSVNDVISGALTKSADARNKLIDDFNALGGRQKVLEGLSTIFGTIGTAIRVAKEEFNKLFPPATAEQLKSIADRFKALADRIWMNQEQIDKFRHVMKGVASALHGGWTIIKMVGKSLLELIPVVLIKAGADLLTWLADLAIKFDEWAVSLDKTKNVFGHLKDYIQSFFDWAVGAFKGGGGLFSGLIDGVKKLYENVKPYIKKVLDLIGELFAGFNFEDFISLGFVGAVTLLVTSINGITDKLKDSFSEVLDKFSLFSGAEGILDKLKDGISSFQKAINAGSLLAIGVGILSLALGVRALANIEPKKLATSVTAITALLGAIRLITGIRIAGGGFGATIIGVSTGLLIMTSAIKRIAKIEPEALNRAIGTLTQVLLTLVGTMTVASRLGGVKGLKSGPIIGMTIALNIIVGAIKGLAKMDEKTLIKSITALGAVMAEMAILAVVMNKFPTKITSGVGMVLMATTLVVVTSSISKLSGINASSLLKAIGAVGAVLGGMAILANYMRGFKGTVVGAALILMATGLTIMSVPLITLSKLKLESLVKGLLGMGAALAIVVTALNLLKPSSILGATAITIAAAGLTLLSVPLLMLSRINAGSLFVSLTVLGLALAGIVVAGTALSGVAGAGLLSFAGAIALIGVGAAGVGAGLMFVAIGLGKLIDLGANGVESLVKALSNLLEAAIQLTPQIALLGINLVVSIIEGLADAAPRLFSAGVEMVMGLLQTIASNIEEFIKLGVDLVLALIKGIAVALPKLIDETVKMIIVFVRGVAKSIRERAPEIIDAVTAVIASLLEVIIVMLSKVFDKFLGWIPGMEGVFLQMGDSAREMLREFFNVEEGDRMANDLVNGISTGLGSAGSKWKPIVEGQSTEAMSAFINRPWSEAGSKAGDSISAGLGAKIGTAHSAGRVLASGVDRGFRTLDLSGAMSYVVSGIESGAFGNIGRLVNVGASLAQTVLSSFNNRLKIKSPSRVFMSAMGYIVDGLVVGESRNRDRLKSAGGNLANEIQNGFDAMGLDILSDDYIYEPTIRPVLDMSNFEWPDLSSVPVSGLLDHHTTIQHITFGDVVTNISTERGNVDYINSRFRSSVRDIIREEFRRV